MSAESPVLTPAQSMAKIVMPPGYRLELVVSEPMVQDPVAIDFDPDGRMYVIEMVGYMEDMPASTEHNPTGRVVVLEDTNDDGTMDKRTVFADGLVLPRALKVLDRGVLDRRTAKPLARARHERRSQSGYQGRRHEHATDSVTPTSSTMPTVSSGRSTTGCTPPSTTASCG